MSFQLSIVLVLSNIDPDHQHLPVYTVQYLEFVFCVLINTDVL